MNEVKKQHDEFLKDYSKKMAKLREPLHKVATSHLAKSKALSNKKK
jgi:hypothetical protein